MAITCQKNLFPFVFVESDVVSAFGQYATCHLIPDKTNYPMLTATTVLLLSYFQFIALVFVLAWRDTIFTVGVSSVYPPRQILVFFGQRALFLTTFPPRKSTKTFFLTGWGTICDRGEEDGRHTYDNIFK